MTADQYDDMFMLGCVSIVCLNRWPNRRLNVGVLHTGELIQCEGRIVLTKLITFVLPKYVFGSRSIGQCLQIRG